MKARTGAERYFRRRLADPEYVAAYKEAKARIERVDALINALDRRRQELDLTKADLARRAGIQPEAVRRLLSSDSPNPTLATVLSLADALDLELAMVQQASVPTQRRSGPEVSSQRATVRRRLNSSPSRRTRA